MNCSIKHEELEPLGYVKCPACNQRLGSLCPSDATDCSGRVLQPDEPVEIGDKILLVGGSWITVNTAGFLARDYIEVRRPNA